MEQKQINYEDIKINNETETEINNENDKKINKLQNNNINEINTIQNILIKLNNMESEIESLKLDNISLKSKSIKSDYEIIKVKFRLIETNEYLKCEKAFNSAYL